MLPILTNGAISLLVFCFFCADHASAGRRLGEVTPPLRLLENTLERIGDNGVPNATFPLLKCKGDCDGYDDCAGDLRCYSRRYAQDSGPPGCDGEVTDGTDFCFDPADDPSIPALGTLYRLYQDGEPSWAFPLRKCQGDCDGDEDCLEGLKCFKRKVGNESDIGPPGCSGDAIGTADFCYDPSDEEESVVLDQETTDVDDEEPVDNHVSDVHDSENESSSRSKKAKIVISIVVVGVVLLLIVGFWFRECRRGKKDDATSESGTAIRAGSPTAANNGKEHETESDEEPPISST